MRIGWREEFKEFRIADYVSLHIEVDDDIARQDPFPRLGRKFTDRDFPAIIDEIRAQNLAEFGAGSDRPD